MISKEKFNQIEEKEMSILNYTYIYLDRELNFPKKDKENLKIRIVEE